MQFVINNCYGGFSLSLKAMQYYCKLKEWEVGIYYDHWGNSPIYHKLVDPNTLDMNILYVFGPQAQEIDITHFSGNILTLDKIMRNDPVLVQVVKELGDEANGVCARLEIVDIDIDIEAEEWKVAQFDGKEWIETRDRW